MVATLKTLDDITAVIAALPFLGVAELERHLSGLIFRTIVVVGIALAYRARSVTTRRADSHVIVDAVISDELAAGRVRTICPVQCGKLQSFLGKSGGELGSDDRSNRIKRDSLLTATGRVHCPIANCVLKESGHATGAIPVTTWSCQCL